MPAQTGTKATGPSHCWHCWNMLHRAPGKGLGLFYFNEVIGADGLPHRVHDACVSKAIAEGARTSPATKENKHV